LHRSSFYQKVVVQEDKVVQEVVQEDEVVHNDLRSLGDTLVASPVL
jgi:hypothetical protein